MADAKRQQIDRLIGRSLLTAETFAAELRERLASVIGEFPADEATVILAEFEPIMAQLLVDAETIAWVAGKQDVVRQLPASVVSLLGEPDVSGRPPGGFEELIGGQGDDEPIIRFPIIERAAERLGEANIVTREEFDEMSAEARANAFTVAGDMTEETIGRIRDVQQETIAEGASLKKFREKLGESLEKGFIGPAHLENVYRTNIQRQFHAAHNELADDPIVREIFPYQEYLPIDDSRVRPEHLALATLGISGTNVYRRDDPFWDVFTPPWGYQCRCGVNLLTIEAAARKGVAEAMEWLRTGRPPAQPEFRLDSIPFRPDPDFVGGGARLSLDRIDYNGVLLGFARVTITGETM